MPWSSPPTSGCIWRRSYPPSARCCISFLADRCKDRRSDLKQVLLSLGVSGDGGLPLRLGIRDGNRSDSVETPLAIEECLALGLDEMRGIVADSKAYSRRTLGLRPEHGIGL